MKRGFLLLMFSAMFLFCLLLPHFADNGVHPQMNELYQVIIDGDNGIQTGDKAFKKASTVPGMSSDWDIETAVIILLLLAQCAAYIPKLWRRLFIGPIFSQSNYVSRSN